MGLLDSLLGNASKMDDAALDRELAAVLTEAERVESAHKLWRDLIVFTNQRLILIDKQGVTGKKAEFLSIPYRSVSRFAVETAGFFDADSDLKIWLSGLDQPLTRKFRRQDNIQEVHRVLAAHVLR